VVARNSCLTLCLISFLYLLIQFRVEASEQTQLKSNAATSSQNLQMTIRATEEKAAFLIESGKAEDALRLLKSMKHDEKPSPRHFFLVGRALQDMKKNTAALSSYSIAVYLDPLYTKALINRALTKGALKDLDGAVEDLDRALAIEPNNAIALSNRGVTKAGINRPKDALLDFDMAITYDSNLPDAHRNRGVTKMLLGDKSGACRDWKIAITLGEHELRDWVRSYCPRTIVDRSRSRR
jgi:tetratricopeptide (TPR) repeat protein